MLGSKTKIREQAGKAFLEKWHLQGDLKEAREEARQISGGGGGVQQGTAGTKAQRLVCAQGTDGKPVWLEKKK